MKRFFYYLLALSIPFGGFSCGKLPSIIENPVSCSEKLHNLSVEDQKNRGVKYFKAMIFPGKNSWRLKELETLDKNRANAVGFILETCNKKLTEIDLSLATSVLFHSMDHDSLTCKLLSKLSVSEHAGRKAFSLNLLQEMNKDKRCISVVNEN